MPEQPKFNEPESTSRTDFRNGLFRVAAFLSIPVAMLVGGSVGTVLAPEGWEVIGSLVGTSTPPLIALGLVVGVHGGIGDIIVKHRYHISPISLHPPHNGNSTSNHV